LRPNLVDTTDCLEAVGVFKCWKNLFFVVIVICLLLIQACFWVVDTGFIKEQGEEADSAGIVSEPVQEGQSEDASSQAEAPIEAVAIESDEIKAAAKEVVGDANAVEQGEAEAERPGLHLTLDMLKPTASQVANALRFLNFVLVPLAVLYCLTMLFSLKISLAGRLGGINHIARAFFLSLIMVVLLLPWQVLFSGVTKGAMFTPAELFAGWEKDNVVWTVLYYLRFVGYWVLVLLLLIMAQARNARWARTILRRLEVV
jgi:hypothetical protein